MDIFLIYVLKTVILPPGINIVLLLAGMLLWSRRPVAAKSMVYVATLTLWIMSTPKFMGLMAEPLESGGALDVASIPADAGAIVVLAGGRRVAPAYNALSVNTESLERLRYAAYLKRKSGLPLAAVGGVVFGDGVPESTLMRDTLENQFGVTVDFLESGSRNTAENASMARRVLTVDNVLLVTHAAHMPRSQRAFEAVGFKVTPAPVYFLSASIGRDLALDWMPSMRALSGSRFVLHEYLGLVWYRLRYSHGA